MDLFTINNWDQNNVWRARGIIKKTGINNPFNKNTIEYYLIKIIEQYDNQNTYSFLRYGSEKLLKLLKEENFYYEFDSYGLYYYVDRALWLGLFHGIIKIENHKKDAPPLFGVYLSSGLKDLFIDEEVIRQLKAQYSKEGQQNLLRLAEILQKYYLLLGMPKLKITNNSDNSIDYRFYNLDKKIISNINYLPLHTWPEVYVDDIKKGERGAIHHLGDEMAFILAAISYGQCYLLGNNDCGDLMVLSQHIHPESLPFYTYNIGDCVNEKDFDYIYGVPRAFSSTPANRNNHFSYSHYQFLRQKSPFPECEKFECDWWNNQVFQKYAGRELKAMSMGELIGKIENNFITALEMPANSILFAKEQLGDLVKIILMEEEILNGMNKNKKYKKAIKKGLFETKIMGLINKYLFAEGGQFQKKEFEWAIDIYKSNLKDCLFRAGLIDQQSKSEIFSLIDKLFDFGWVENMFFLIKNKNEQVINNNQFFYKTISHKEHCDLINYEDSSFFKKGNKHQTVLDLIKLTRSVWEGLEAFYFERAHEFRCNTESTCGRDANKTRQKDKEYLKEYQKLIFMEFLLPIGKGSLIRQDIWDKFNDNLFNKAVINILTKGNHSGTRDLFNYWLGFDEKCFIYSETIPMKYEYRIFVVDHRPRASSACFREGTPFDCYENGRFDPRLSDGHSANIRIENRHTRKIAAAYAKFSRKFAAEVKKESPEYKHYVVDLALKNRPEYFDSQGNLNLDKHKVSDLEIIPIEINSILYSGAYSIDFRRVLATFAGETFNKKNIDSICDYKKIISDYNRASQAA